MDLTIDRTRIYVVMYRLADDEDPGVFSTHITREGAEAAAKDYEAECKEEGLWPHCQCEVLDYIIEK